MKHKVGRVAPRAPFCGTSGAHGVTRPTIASGSEAQFANAFRPWDLSRIFRRFAVAAALAMLARASSAQAHPGHDLLDASPAHLLTSPDHLLVLGLVGTAMLIGARLVHERLPRRVLQFSGALAVVGAIVLWGMRP